MRNTPPVFLVTCDVCKRTAGINKHWLLIGSPLIEMAICPECREELEVHETILEGIRLRKAAEGEL